MKTYIVESQLIFVPRLVEMLRNAGLQIVRVRDVIDPLDIIRIRPAVLFIDYEAGSDDVAQAIRFLYTALPSMQFLLYSMKPPDPPLVNEGEALRLKFVPKSLDMDNFIAALRGLLAQ